MVDIVHKESEVYHNTDTYQGNGTACKFLVEQLLGFCPELTVHKVSTDTSLTYDVVLRVLESNLAFKISNSSTYLYCSAGIIKSDGTYAANSDNNTTCENFFGYYYTYSSPTESWYPYLKVHTVGVDGVLKYILFQTSYYNNIALIHFGKFTSTAYSEPTVCVRARKDKLGATYPAIPSIPFGYELPNLIEGKEVDTTETVSYTSAISNAGLSKAGYSHGKFPMSYYAYSTTKAFFNIKWGGRYDLYILCSSTGYVTTDFGEVLTIDGQQYTSPGYVGILE